MKNMNAKANLKSSPRMELLSSPLNIKYFIVSVLILIGMQAPLQAQEAEFTKPSWWIGGSAGANFNFYRGTTQRLNSGLKVPAGFHHGDGVGLYLAPLVEFHRPQSRWGLMLQSGYDGRDGSFDKVVSPCNCLTGLSTKLRYITVEPSLRFAPFKSNFYLFGGPRLAFNVTKSFVYSQKTNPDFPEQVANPDVKGDFSVVHKRLISMQVGVGYDIPLSSRNMLMSAVFSPFISFQPYFGQSPRSIETWNITTVRVGAALKFGRGHKISPPVVSFSINSPKNSAVERRVRETFPLRNYVFFNEASTVIPDRYVLLSKAQVKDFKDGQLEVFAPKKLSDRSGRAMIVYYNVLNILGDRMQKNLSSTITLVGSSSKGLEDARAMTESIKRYLSSVFEIDPSRISMEGRDKPKFSSVQAGGKRDLLREGDDRRVSVESSAPDLLMEFQSGPDVPLQPLEIKNEAPLDSYVSFSVEGASKAFAFWSLEIKDEKDHVQYFGPYTQENLSLPGESILAERPEGDYKVTMIGQTKNNKMIRKETFAHIVRWTPPKNEEGMRFSVIFEFDESKVIAMYEKYLTEIVTSKIPNGGTVVIRGHTDIIGDRDHNLTLSMARANEVRSIMENSLMKAGRSDVTFEVFGYGEDQNVSPFENKFPEGRFHNRTVLIDIIPRE